jgi:hypothetical protein
MYLDNLSAVLAHVWFGAREAERQERGTTRDGGLTTHRRENVYGEFLNLANRLDKGGFNGEIVAYCESCTMF